MQSISVRRAAHQPRRTIADVARAARVHPSTVSRALNDGAVLRDETRKRVVRAARRLDYRPSAVARSLRLQRTLTLGMLVPDIANPFFPPIIRGAEDVALSCGYALVLCNTEDVPEREATYLRVLRQRQVDGLLIASSRMSDAVITRLRRERFPFVLVNRSARGAELTVTVDNRRSAAEAVGHLAALGHRRVGHIAGPQSTTTGLERAEGARLAIGRHGLAADAALWIEATAFSEEEGYRCARVLLALGRRPTAIFGANDLIAVGALRAIRDARLRVPEDVSVVGFNDIRQAELLEPPLTTVHVPQYEMGAAAARLLIARLGGDPIPESHLVLPATLAVRASTARASSAAGVA
ncbi:MAG: LacI family transcriptional regulator [Chloroflexi bacterium]|nr:MAG: LacI family transcriptional regulator [Chloroflexota bacterium]